MKSDPAGTCSVSRGFLLCRKASVLDASSSGMTIAGGAVTRSEPSSGLDRLTGRRKAGIYFVLERVLPHLVVGRVLQVDFQHVGQPD